MRTSVWASEHATVRGSVQVHCVSVCAARVQFWKNGKMEKKLEMKNAPKMERWTFTAFAEFVFTPKFTPFCRPRTGGFDTCLYPPLASLRCHMRKSTCVCPMPFTCQIWAWVCKPHHVASMRHVAYATPNSSKHAQSPQLHLLHLLRTYYAPTTHLLRTYCAPAARSACTMARWP